MRRSLILAACLATGLTPLVAQDPRPAGRDEVQREIEARERAMREGRVVRNNVRITVRLKNGSKLGGVVRNGRFIERHDGLQFVPADLRVEGAGVRLWYYDQTNSYVFLPFETIDSHTIGKVLTDDEVREIGLQFDREQRERLARLRAEQARREATAKAGGDGAGDGAGSGPAGDAGQGDPAPVAGAGGDEVPELTEAQRALLAEFPPGAEWYPAKLGELERRKVVIGVFPNQKEQRFMDNFAAWNEAYEVWREIEQREAAQNGGVGGTPAPKPGATPPGATPPGATPPGATPPGGVGPRGGTPSTDRGRRSNGSGTGR